MQSPQSQADCTNLQEDRPVCSGSEIPRQGRSPDFVLRGSALPGFPVVGRTHRPSGRSGASFAGPLPYTVTASLRIHTGFPFHPPRRRTPWRYNFILFQTAHIITHIGKESTGEIDSFPRSAAAFPGENARKRGKCPADTGSAGRFGSSARDYCINVPAIIWSM